MKMIEIRIESVQEHNILVQWLRDKGIMFGITDNGISIGDSDHVHSRIKVALATIRYNLAVNEINDFVLSL
jgi:hypothetical protein